ncbi:HEAT repeat domain-containing protein [Pelagicoccus sp. SDUM812003]|uniref:HEAT repeat domain-containing protein n=1 Tax=Pelagicoccus sp. SDUM812003 TaxID=3041267 RepID=UPI00280F84FD|nr:HEAT repeat domain-containing protein [Pelagicoccus sp. SDUM812003]MDQ8204337.1 HEAT repeat domain-containing protein [Pelagicoccus sp. SDUM812003]
MSLEQFIADLDSDDEAARICAAEDIGFENDPSGVSPLVARLAIETQRSVQESLFLAIERIEGDESIAALVDCLRMDDAFCRNEAVMILQRRRQSALPALQALLDDPDPDVRKFALDAVAGWGHEELASFYRRALGDESVNVVITAVEYVGQHRLTFFKEDLERLFLERANPMLQTACLQALLDVGDAQSAELVLRRFPTLEVTPIHLLDDWLRALGKIAGTDRFNTLIGSLAYVGDNYLDSWVDAFVRMGRRAGVTMLEEMMQARILELVTGDALESATRVQLVSFLFGLKANAAVDSALLNCLCDPDPAVRLCVANEALAGKRDVWSGRLSERLALESDSIVRERLREAVLAFEGKARSCR